MDITIIELLLGLVPLFAALIGIHIRGQRLLRQELQAIDLRLSKAISEDRVRLLIHDQLLPIRVEYKSLEYKIEELKGLSVEKDQKIKEMLTALIDVELRLKEATVEMQAIKNKLR